MDVGRNNQENEWVQLKRGETRQPRCKYGTRLHLPLSKLWEFRNWTSGRRGWEIYWLLLPSWWSSSNSTTSPASFPYSPSNFIAICQRLRRQLYTNIKILILHKPMATMGSTYYQEVCSAVQAQEWNWFNTNFCLILDNFVWRVATSLEVNQDFGPDSCSSWGDPSKWSSGVRSRRPHNNTAKQTLDRIMS